MGPEALAQVLRPLTLLSHPNLIVGLQTSDDAAVFQLAEDLAIVQTVDFFTPIVDDPFTYGAISAANSLSDVYAMGGDVILALNVAALPEDLPPAVLTAIFEGGAAKVQEAGGVIAGGHTIIDDEPKYGLCVTGTIHPQQVYTKAGARPGDRLFLTKPLGTGLITTALKNGVVQPAHLDGAVEFMLRLNKEASFAMRSVRPTSCTDITGFGLLGHAFEVAERSDARIVISAERVPVLPGALAYAAAGQKAGGLFRNLAYFTAQGVQIDPAISDDMVAVLFDPQTSGGLLMTVPEERAGRLRDAFAERSETLWEIGFVEPGSGVLVVP
jgi:selenide,water dikinase